MGCDGHQDKRTGPVEVQMASPATRLIPMASWVSATKTRSPSPNPAARTSAPGGRARPRSRRWR